MSEATISLVDSKSLVSLLGTRDQHLKAIRDALGVSVAVRNDQIRISGDEPAVAKATTIVEQLKELLNWFAENLKTPDRFHASHSKGRSDRATKGISWLKPEAVEHIAKMHELASTLGECGYVVDVITSSRPGYVVYEDRYQIVAEAFADVGA